MTDVYRSRFMGKEMNELGDLSLCLSLFLSSPSVLFPEEENEIFLRERDICRRNRGRASRTLSLSLSLSLSLLSCVCVCDRIFFISIRKKKKERKEKDEHVLSIDFSLFVSTVRTSTYVRW